MDKDKVIELAKQAGFNWPEVLITTIEERLERLIQLVRDDYRADLLAGSGEPVWYHGIDEFGCNRFYYKDEVRPIKFDTPLHTADQQAAAVLRERERLLAGYREIAESSDLAMRDGDLAREIAAKMLQD